MHTGHNIWKEYILRLLKTPPFKNLKHNSFMSLCFQVSSYSTSVQGETSHRSDRYQDLYHICLHMLYHLQYTKVCVYHMMGVFLPKRSLKIHDHSFKRMERETGIIWKLKSLYSVINIQIYFFECFRCNQCLFSLPYQNKNESMWSRSSLSSFFEFTLLSS